MPASWLFNYWPESGPWPSKTERPLVDGGREGREGGSVSGVSDEEEEDEQWASKRASERPRETRDRETTVDDGEGGESPLELRTHH